MRGFLTVILFIVFFLTFPIAVITYSISSIVTADYLKNHFSESKIYTVVASELPEVIIHSKNGADKMVSAEVKTELSEFIKKELTAEYLQGKTEPLVDDTFAWLAGKTETAPTLDLSDLGKKIEPLGVSYLLSEEFSETISEPIKFEPEGSEQLRSGFQWLQIAPIIFSIISAIVLLVIFLMAKGWRSKLRKVSLTLFIPTILGLLTVASTFIIGNLLIGIGTGKLEGSVFEQFSKPLNDLLIQIPLDVSVRMAAIYGVVLAVAFLLFIISFFVGRKAQNLAKGTTTNEEPTIPIQKETGESKMEEPITLPSEQK